MKGTPKDPQAARKKYLASLRVRFEEKSLRLFPEYRRLVNETTLSREDIATRLHVCRKTLSDMEAFWGVDWPPCPRPKIGPLPIGKEPDGTTTENSNG